MGSHLSHYFSKLGHQVSGIDNYFHSCEQTVQGHCQYGDIRNSSDMEQGILWSDIVIHLAAQIHVDYSIAHPAETIDINVIGTLNVLELCKKYKKKVIVASTSEAYGSSQVEFMSEDHPLDCQSPYGASKVAADRLAKSYIDTYGMDIVIIRNFNAFGPYQNDGSYGSVIARFTKAALENKDLFIYGTGKQERDYMYIDDICQAYNFAINLPSGVYNFGTGKCFTIESISKLIVDYITPTQSKVVHLEPRAGEVQRLCCDISKVSELGFVPNTDFKRDLYKYIDWYKENMND